MPMLKFTHSHVDETFFNTDVWAFFQACLNKYSSVWVSLSRIQTLDEKINTRFIWGRPKQHKWFFLPFWGSGVCVVLCTRNSRDSLCLFHATRSVALKKAKICKTLFAKKICWIFFSTRDDPMLMTHASWCFIFKRFLVKNLQVHGSFRFFEGKISTIFTVLNDRLKVSRKFCWRGQKSKMNLQLFTNQITREWNSLLKCFLWTFF